MHKRTDGNSFHFFFSLALGIDAAPLGYKTPAITSASCTATFFLLPPQTPCFLANLVSIALTFSSRPDETSSTPPFSNKPKVYTKATSTLLARLFFGVVNASNQKIAASSTTKKATNRRQKNQKKREGKKKERGTKTEDKKLVDLQTITYNHI